MITDSLSPSPDLDAPIPPTADSDGTVADTDAATAEERAPAISQVHDSIALGVAGERVEVSDSLIGAVATGELHAKDTLILCCVSGDIEGENTRVLVTPGLAVLAGAAAGLTLALIGIVLGRSRAV